MTVVTVSHGLDPTRCIHCIVTLKLECPRTRHRGSLWCKVCKDKYRWRRHPRPQDGCGAYPWMEKCRDLV